MAQADDRYQALQQGTHQPPVQDFIQGHDKGLQKGFAQVKQVLRSSLRIAFQVFEGF
jgi:hypothetical protein